MGWFKILIDSFRAKNDMFAKNPNMQMDDTPMGWNIYTGKARITRKEFAAKFGKIHQKFKYKLIVPIFILAKRFFLPKYKHTGMFEKNGYNREMIVLEKSFNDAMEDMALLFYQNNNTKQGWTKEHVLKELKENREYMDHMKTFKQSWLLMMQWDTYHHEFGTFFMHRVYKNMGKEFQGEKYNRVVYDGDSIRDAEWFVIQRLVAEKAPPQEVFKEVKENFNLKMQEVTENVESKEGKESTKNSGTTN